jgi:3-deoxy-7-phosphoheptulonate synthase
MTRTDSTTGDWYATSGHMVWIGDRTRQLDHAHVEYFRGIKNPIGLKCGPSLKPDDLLRLIDALDPQNQAGRLVADRPLRCTTRSSTTCRLWCARSSGKGARKSSGPAIRCTATRSRRRAATRPVRSTVILTEVKNFFADASVPKGRMPGGLHLEMTGKDVTECTGGARGMTGADLNDRYHTVCDPRLNAEQALELAFLVAERLKSGLRREADGGERLTALT